MWWERWLRVWAYVDFCILMTFPLSTGSIVSVSSATPIGWGLPETFGQGSLWSPAKEASLSKLSQSDYLSRHQISTTDKVPQGGEMLEADFSWQWCPEETASCCHLLQWSCMHSWVLCFLFHFMNHEIAFQRVYISQNFYCSQLRSLSKWATGGQEPSTWSHH